MLDYPEITLNFAPFLLALATPPHLLLPPCLASGQTLSHSMTNR